MIGTKYQIQGGGKGGDWDKVSDSLFRVEVRVVIGKKYQIQGGGKGGDNRIFLHILIFQVFQMITKWYESNPGDRKCKMGTFLSALKLHLICKDDFYQVSN